METKRRRKRSQRVTLLPLRLLQRIRLLQAQLLLVRKLLEERKRKRRIRKRRRVALLLQMTQVINQLKTDSWREHEI